MRDSFATAEVGWCFDDTAHDQNTRAILEHMRAQQTLAAGLVEALGVALDRCDALERERDALIVALAKTQKGQAQQ